MNKRLRFIVVLFFLGLGAYFLFPTVQWYFNTPEEKKILANGSKEQIRNYAKVEASKDLKSLIELVKDSPDAELPENIKFLVPVAKENFKLEKLDIPKTWTVQSVLKGFQSGNEVFKTLEEYYRDDILNLKALKNKTLMLGLDLSGGMSVVVEADTESLTKRLERPRTEDDV
jgi:preprotein translocase subunit SecD